MWRIDVDTARWICENVNKLKEGKILPFDTCPDCGASYFESLGHDCNRVIEVETIEEKSDDFPENFPDGWCRVGIRKENE